MTGNARWPSSISKALPPRDVRQWRTLPGACSIHSSSCSIIEVAMKQLTIVVRPFKAEAVLKAINELDVIACSVQEAKGYSRQKGYLERYLGSEYSMAFLHNVDISVWASHKR